MPQEKTDLVDAYLAAQSPAARKVLAEVRRAVREALPAADETISYSIPAYKLNRRVALYFAAWKNHYAIYPVTQTMTKALKKEFAPYELSGRGTIRFPYSDPVPVRLISRIAQFRADEVIAAAKQKARKA